ncbi:MAG: hypothetical protein Q8M29_18430 [Bacteroidota bacterium]|nr:hypothetical protein [Bacteroidota bacterium]
MKHTIVIDDRTSMGKHLLALIKDLSETTKSVGFVKETVEAEEDAALAKMIKAGLKSGLADKKTVLKKLGIK